MQIGGIGPLYDQLREEKLDPLEDAFCREPRKVVFFLDKAGLPRNLRLPSLSTHYNILSFLIQHLKISTWPLILLPACYLYFILPFRPSQQLINDLTKTGEEVNAGEESKVAITLVLRQLLFDMAEESNAEGENKDIHDLNEPDPP